MCGTKGLVTLSRIGVCYFGTIRVLILMAIIYESIHEITVLVGSSYIEGSNEAAQKHSIA